MLTHSTTKGARDLTPQKCLNAIRVWRTGNRNKYRKAAGMDYLADFARFSSYPLARFQFHTPITPHDLVSHYHKSFRSAAKNATVCDIGGGGKISGGYQQSTQAAGAS